MQDGKPEEENKRKKKENKRVDFKTAKNVCDLHGILNDIAMMRIPPSKKPPVSEVLGITKAQHTKLAIERNEKNPFKQEEEKHLREKLAKNKQDLSTKTKVELFNLRDQVKQLGLATDKIIEVELK